MSGDKMKIALEILGSSAGAQAALRQTQSSVRNFVNTTRQEFKSIQGFMGSTMGKLAGIGVGFGAFQLIQGSAMLDKSLTRIGQMAGVGKDKVKQLRDELFTLSERTGKPIELLSQGFGELIASGRGFDQARGMIVAINDASAVTNASAETLAVALKTASEIFGNIDLSKTKESVLLLDKMAVGADLGSAELENLGAMFSKVAPRAKDVGMSFEQTIAFLELLSKVENSPDILGTMADATLKIFNNTALINRLERKGVSFFNSDKSRRSVFEVFQDLRTQYKKIDSERGQQNFMSMMFQGVDERSMRGLRSLLGTDILDSADEFVNKIDNAGGKIAKDLPEAINNSIDQVGRLNAALRDAAESFSRPINRTLTRSIKFMMDEYGMSGGQIVGLGAAGLMSAYLGGRMIKGWAGRLLQAGTGTMGGVAAGKAIEAAAGVTPVFVTNWPIGGLPVTVAGSGIPGIAGGIGKRAATGAALGLAPPLLAASLVGIGAFGAYKINQKNTETRLSEIELQRRISEKGYASDEIRDAVLKAKGLTPPVNIEITIDKEGRQIVKSNARDTSSSVNVRNRGSFYLGTTQDGTPLYQFPGSN
jgi:TP901 family phage tail tape measure protein